MIKIDARGDACPLPVVKAKKAIAAVSYTHLDVYKRQLCGHCAERAAAQGR